MIYTILIVLQVLVALGLVALILMQHGKGADAGAAFGSGASGTVFGAQGTANFMSRATAGLATLFMVLSLVLAYLVNGASAGGDTGSVLDSLNSGTHQEQSTAADNDRSASDEDRQAEDTGKAAKDEDNEDESNESDKEGKSSDDKSPQIPD